ncbi:hypothetical protein BKK81_01540 [Cupriavidus sp. USMAHM13]|uniref:Uncharacterized protein n=1 Tax=Cupriavidus malaysiensis TaxID=367825 RepID=A0ABM6EZN0_9BURK|nr:MULTISPECIES: hypothetical protein [Cupriavidus]AOY98124.1 hypothetical protein BKK81_01540 [Cupriavidus sp. USMAHM13]AOZ04553.1 hypothetical protein BKK80_00875 [Cupriavidus malaysiensis]
MGNTGKGWPHDAETHERGIWRTTIAAASQALDAATRIQQTVGVALKLQNKVRELRAQLHETRTQRDHYRARLEAAQRALRLAREQEQDGAAEASRLRADGESLQMRHRAYKLLIDHYARLGLPIDPVVFSGQRRRVLQHILYQRRKGVPLAEIGAKDIAFLLR